MIGSQCRMLQHGLEKCLGGAVSDSQSMIGVPRQITAHTCHLIFACLLNIFKVQLCRRSCKAQLKASYLFCEKVSYQKKLARTLSWLANMIFHVFEIPCLKVHICYLFFNIYFSWYFFQVRTTFEYFSVHPQFPFLWFRKEFCFITFIWLNFSWRHQKSIKLYVKFKQVWSNVIWNYNILRARYK